MGWFNPFEGGSSGGGGGGGAQEVIAHTTSEWESLGTVVSTYGMIYIYTDYAQESGQTIAAIKIGDGSTIISNLPFITKGTPYDPRISNSDIQDWNQKVRVNINQENLTFSF